ncbi:MAG: type III-B CRISPR module RAMP protein Cmr6 [Spartobacteria bacterium]|nr:type III-B CRISPR module RAMP protein Cmr6 [Spartobacteria bacterium]
MQQTVTKEVADLLGGNSFHKAESASLRMTKYCHLGNNCSHDEINDACSQIRTDVATRRWQKRGIAPDSLPHSASLLMRLAGDLAINLSGGIWEHAGMSIHPHFNIPVIPGSAVKGVARHYAWLRWSEMKTCAYAEQMAIVFGFPTGDKDLDEFLRKEKPETYGKTGSRSTMAGAVAFTAAYPTDDHFHAECDVLTCHHMKYYSGDDEYNREYAGKAMDNENPNPQFFPVIKKGALFQFNLLPIRQHNLAPYMACAEMMSDAVDLLKNALEENGIGAKTAAGYGWFIQDIDAQKKLADQKQAEMQERETAAKLSSMSPLEQALDILRGMTDLQERAGFEKNIMGKSEIEKKAYIQLLQDEWKDYWKDLKKRVKKKATVKERVDHLLRISAETGGALS